MRYKVTYKSHGKQHTYEVWAGSQAQAEKIAYQMFGELEILKVEKI